MILWWSRRGTWGIDLRGYLGVRDSWRVFGRWNVVEVRILRDFEPLIPEPLMTALAAAPALLLGLVLVPVEHQS